VKVIPEPKSSETRVPHTGGKLLVKQKGLRDFSVAAFILRLLPSLRATPSSHKLCPHPYGLGQVDLTVVHPLFSFQGSPPPF